MNVLFCVVVWLMFPVVAAFAIGNKKITKKIKDLEFIKSLYVSDLNIIV